MIKSHDIQPTGASTRHVRYVTEGPWLAPGEHKPWLAMMNPCNASPDRDVRVNNCGLKYD